MTPKKLGLGVEKPEEGNRKGDFLLYAPLSSDPHECISYSNTGKKKKKLSHFPILKTALFLREVLQ